MYKYEEDLFHFGAKKGILGNRAGKVAPNRRLRRRHRLPLLEIVPAHQRPGEAARHFWKLYRRINASMLYHPALLPFLLSATFILPTY